MNDKTRTELDQIEAQAEAATTIEEYEAADAAFYAVDRAARTAWLNVQVQALR